ncbi:MerR family transcriptional regulator [Pseudomonadota bacterium]
MLDPAENLNLPPIPGKRYFTIGEVSELCAVKPHVLRYWEQEFPQLKPVKRRGNRRYYQRHEVQLIRQIRNLLYVDGFTISGARNKLDAEIDEAPPSVTQVTPRSVQKLSKETIRNLIKELDEVVELLKS